MATGRPATYVRRFEAPMRLVHWGLAVPFLLLTLTGLTNYVPRLKAIEFMGGRLFALLHVVLGFAMLAIAVLAILALLRARSLRRDAAALAALTPEDIQWFEHEARALTGQRSVPPPVGKFNAGQKANALFFFAVTAGLLITGLLLGINYMDKRVLTVGFVGAVFPWHTLLTLVSIPVVLAHIYLAALNPSTRESLRGITLGLVRRDWAARHHPAWRPPDTPVPVPRGRGRTER